MHAWIRILLVWMVLILGMGVTNAQESRQPQEIQQNQNSQQVQVVQQARGVEDAAYGMTLDNETIEAWLGRERRLTHPVMDGLEARDEATLHFYFSRTYGQRAEAVIRSARTAREKSLRFLPEETVAGINVYLLGDINEYFDAQKSRGRAPAWAAGLTLLSDGVILIRVGSNGMSRIEPERTLAHELNHAALRRYVVENEVPHWFYEGLAMLATDDWSPERTETISRASMAGSLLELNELGPAFGKTGAIVDLAYAESAFFTMWLSKEYGDESIRRLIRDVHNGKPFDAAFESSFGHTPNALFATWMSGVAHGKSILASLFSKDGPFALISLFAAVGLSVALWRKRGIRRRRKESMAGTVPLSALPENLRHFGPFTGN